MWVQVTLTDSNEDREVINTNHIVRVRFLETSATVYFVDGNEETYTDPQSVSNLTSGLTDK